MKKIVAFFIRHGETDMNEKNEFRGDEDVPLNEVGHAQAQELVPYFNAREFSVMAHSDRQRTKQTLEPLAEAKGMTPVQDSNLNSLDTGDFTGLPKNDENKAKLEWYRENPTVKIPGGDAVQDWRNNLDPALVKYVKIGDESGKPAAVSVHGSVMREISRLFHQGDYNKIKVDPGGVIAIYRDPQGYTAEPLLRENETEEHIKAGS